MKVNLFMRQRTVLDREVREPTLLTIALATVGVAALLGVCLVWIIGLPVFGYVGWTFAVVAASLAELIFGPRALRSAPGPATIRQQWLRRTLGVARWLFIAVLTCWLGLIAWLTFAPGGPDPSPKAELTWIRVLTWNIHCGQEKGLPWQQFDWPARKASLRAAIDQARPDVLCVQEAIPEQVAFLETTLPGHHRVGVGRDGAAAGGEHCSIYYDRQRFAEIGGDTFWLEEPIDQPRVGSALDVKRICTWVRLRDRIGARTLRVYNTHLYLTEAPRLTAARLILAHIAAGDPADAVLLTADFNASPAAPSRRLFTEAGLADSAERAGTTAGKATFHLYGIGLWCIDGILVDRHWRVHQHRILDVKPENTFPSDHFAILTDLALSE